MVWLQMKPLQQYFHSGASHGAIDLGAYIVLSFEWMKSYGVTIQMKPLQKYFHMVNYLFSM